MVVEVSKNAWYLIVERGDKPAGWTFGTVDTNTNDYASWMVWASAYGPFSHSYPAHREKRYLAPFSFMDNGTFALPKAPELLGVIRWHLAACLSANASEPFPIPEPSEPAFVDYLDDVVECDCGAVHSFAEIDEEDGTTVIWCERCRNAISMDNVLDQATMGVE